MLTFAPALRAAAAEFTPPKVFRLQNIIVDSSAQPLPGAMVALYIASDFEAGAPMKPKILQQATAGQNGIVRFTVTLPTSYILVASKPGLSVGWVEWSPQTNQVDSASELALTVPAAVSGTVNDAGGKPVPDAEVWVSFALRPSESGRGFQGGSPFYTSLGRLYMAARTTSDGRFRIERLPVDAALNLAASKPGLALDQQSLSAMAGWTPKYKAGESNIVLTLKPSGAVEGLVVEEDTGTPVAGARVLLGSAIRGNIAQAVSITGTDGVFRMADLGECEYFLRAAIGTNQFRDWLCEPVTATVVAGATNQNIKILASRGGVIDATIHDTAGQPLKGAQVSVASQNGGDSAPTSDRGVARLRLRPGDYSLRVAKEGWRAYESQVKCEKGQTNLLEITLEQAPRIAGTVLDPEGKPASNVAVTLFPKRNGDTLTDAQGQFSLTWDPNRFDGMGNVRTVIIVRDVVRNLATTLDVDETITNASLRLEPGLTLAGRVNDGGGNVITNAEFYVMFHTERLSAPLSQPIPVEADGRFEIKALPTERHYGITVMAKGYGNENQDVETINALERGAKLDVGSIQLPVANLRIAGVVVDEEDKPAADVRIYSQGNGQPSVKGLTDSQGRFSFDHVCAGSIQLVAHSLTSHGITVAEGGDTNITLKLGELSPMGGMVMSVKSKLTGTIVDLDGKPAANVLVSLFPFNPREKTTDAEGRFTLTSDSNRPGGIQPSQRVVIARDPARNLAVALELESEVTNADLRLAPAWTLASRVVATNGVAIPGAQAQALFTAQGMTVPFGSPALADAEGRFEIKALPAARGLSAHISAKGFGQDTINADPPEGNARRVELDPVQLPAADQQIAGAVLDADDKPVIGAWVNSYGQKQPNLSGRTDSKGRFAFKPVCAGLIEVSANGQRGESGLATAAGGDTNIIIRIATRADTRASAAPPTSLAGKPLPDLAPLGLTDDDAPANRRLLAVLVDAEERPSRRVLKRLADLSDTLNEKGVSVVVLQAGTMEGEALAAWKKEAALPFPIGLMKGNRDKTRAAWGAAALPWLILTDAHRKVTDEGFAPGELDEKLNPTDK